VLQYLFDDDVLDRNLAGNAVGIVEVDHVKDIRLYVLAHLIECRTIKAHSGISIVNIFADKRVARNGDLFFQREHLTLYGAHRQELRARS
jgi:hypothetical protein